MLRRAQQLSWQRDSAKALVVIGDATPHPPSYTDQSVFWRDELEKLVRMGIKVYGVQVRIHVMFTSLSVLCCLPFLCLVIGSKP